MNCKNIFDTFILLDNAEEDWDHREGSWARRTQEQLNIDTLPYARTAGF